MMKKSTKAKKSGSRPGLQQTTRRDGLVAPLLAHAVHATKSNALLRCGVEMALENLVTDLERVIVAAAQQGPSASETEEAKGSKPTLREMQLAIRDALLSAHYATRCYADYPTSSEADVIDEVDSKLGWALYSIMDEQRLSIEGDLDIHRDNLTELNGLMVRAARTAEARAKAKWPDTWASRDWLSFELLRKDAERKLVIALGLVGERTLAAAAAG